MSFLELIEKNYQAVVTDPNSDIKDHLGTLYELGMDCDSITEMGTRFGHSAISFLKTEARFTAYDIELCDPVSALFEKAKEAGKNVNYIKADVLEIEIEPTDLLFIDTWHSNMQLRRELALHGNKAQKYLAFHDTQTYGLQDESWNPVKPNHPGAGLLPAIIDFVITNPHWQFHIFKTNNNGLTVLKRMS